MKINKLRKAIVHRLIRIYYFSGPRNIKILKSLVNSNRVNVYWGNFYNNFGDHITPLVLEYYGFTPVYCNPAKADLISTGSLLEHVPSDFSGYILGSGSIREDSILSFEKAKILAVRGNLTRNRLKLHNDLPVGDPGILASLFVSKDGIKKFKLGVIPHFVDKNSTIFKDLKNQYPKDITIIDVQQKPLKVFEEISQCENIISSSLHGLIVADSLNIPNAWLNSRKVIGGRYKFDDYYTALGVVRNPISIRKTDTLKSLINYTDLKPERNIVKMKANMQNLFMGLKNIIK